MKRLATILGVAGIATAMLAGTALAQGADVKLNAPIFKASLVQAMDECASGITEVSNVLACPQANSSTDGTRFTKGKVIVKKDNKVIVSMASSGTTPTNKALAGLTVHARIVVRITATTGTLVTWEDQTLDCPNVVIGTTGAFAQSTTLVACGLGNSLLAAAKGNKEILSVSIINNANSKAIATGGVRSKV